MSHHFEQTPKTESTSSNTRILDYPTLVEAVQLSTARLLDIKGSHDAHSFAEVLEGKNTEERERLICEIGSRFDDELINFVTISLIAQHNRRLVILADASEGIDGVLPWQPKLEQHLQMLRDTGNLREAHLQVERYAASDIESLTQQAQAHALETLPTN